MHINPGLLESEATTPLLCPSVERPLWCLFKVLLWNVLRILRREENKIGIFEDDVVPTFLLNSFIRY